MARSRKASIGAAETERAVHLAARLEDSLHEFREKRARRRGRTPVVIPYTGYGAPGWIRVLCRVLLAKPGAEDDTRYKKIRGWRSFTSVPVNDAAVTITIGGIAQTVQTDRGGVVDEVLDCRLTPGWHTITISIADSAPIEAPVFVVDPSVRFGVISDVDDTVMVTALPRPLLAAWNTFVLDEHARRPVPGMGVLYERLLRTHPGAPIIYLSTGAWNVAPTLTRFLSRNLFPPGPLLLTDWGPTHDRWFRSGQEHKVLSLNRLAEEFPGIRWLLIGDDGQHDEQLYDDFARKNPENVDVVAIRQLSGGEAVLAGGRSRVDEHSERHDIPWIYAPDGAGLADKLGEAGVLAPQ